MSRVVQDFTDLLLKEGVISLDQLTEAEEVAKSTTATSHVGRGAALYGA